MAEWPYNNRKSNPASKDIEFDIFAGSLKSSCVDLMQNCDLPPPSKVFSGADQTAVNRSFSLTEARTEFDVDAEKLELLKALRLSQTRAREAEKKAANLVKERETICSAFLRESMEVLAYRQWVTVLEVQVSKMQEQGDKDDWGEDEEMEGFSWFAALAICLGIAFGCRYLF